jgi:hypothetical protein
MLYLNTRAVTFRWAAAAGATSYRLHVGATTSPKDEGAPLFRSDPLPAGTTSFAHTFDDDHASLYWQITAHDSGGTSASPAQRFGIDRSPPTCVVQGLPSTVGNPVFPVAWSGLDDRAGLGVYEVQFLDLGRGSWRTWLRSPAASAAFTGQPGHSYSSAAAPPTSPTTPASSPPPPTRSRSSAANPASPTCASSS